LTSERPAGGTAAVRGRSADGGLPGFAFEPHHCFACGELNEQGLHLQLHVTREGCWTELNLEPRFQGWESVAHGGIVATLLDEVMAWSVIGRDTWGVTARMSIAYRKPVPVGRMIRAEGRVVEDRRRMFRTAGRVIDMTTGETLADAEGTFVAAPPDQLAILKARYRLRHVERQDAADTTERVDAGGSGAPTR
jgi:acyl-coenzyme A thioesterase PaaI-like protein